MSFTLTHLLIAAVVVLLAALPLCSLIVRKARHLSTPEAGEFIAEVWLEWPLCRGSTLYRGRFKYRWMARLAMKLHAMALDGILPTHYWAEDWSGRRYMERHEYGIYFGVRAPSPNERANRVPDIWSPTMPGTESDRGEHRVAHPVWGEEALAQAEQAYGVKL